ncbi:MAG TPA: N-acetyltransferase [candidate division Zixibacteria bacterium]|nr:N-acetyltransferase [candidate division Zixibacteria bacterium]
MGKIDIVEVESSSDLNRFIDYPNQLYAGDPNYVTPLKMERKAFFDTRKNPFYRLAKTRLFLAERDDRVVGRIATCIDYNYIDLHEEQVGFFGFFDCEDDYEAASSLLKVAMIELKRQGMEKMRGPFNFSTNHECGFLVDGFDSPPVIMMTYNKPYIPRLVEKFGLKKAMDLLAYKMTKDSPVSDRIRKIAAKQQERSSVKLRSLDMKNFSEEVEKVRQVYNQAWQHNWGFVPLSEEEFDHIAADLKQVVDPDLVIIAEHEDKPVAFLMAVPDLNQALIHLKGRLFPIGIFKLLWHTKIRNKVNGVRIITMGVIPEYQKRGIDSMMYIKCYDTGLGKGYQWGEMSWILETNELMRNAAEQLGAVLYKRYRIVEMPL